MNLNTRWGWWLLTLASIGWLLWMTLRPHSKLNGINLIPLVEHGRALVCLISGECASGRKWRFFLIDVLGNILIFVPLGTGLAGIWPGNNRRQTIRRAAILGLLVSLTIELIQLTIPTRFTDVDDLIFNTVGTMLGAIIFVAVQQKKLSPNDS